LKVEVNVALFSLEGIWKICIWSLIGNSNINALPLKEAFTTLHGIINKTTYSVLKVGNIG
jgi:hypothetical protein